MKQFITDLWNKWLGSFDNQKNYGFSARKLTVFAVAIAYLYCHRYVTTENVMDYLMIDAGLICTLLGITTWQQGKNDNKQKDEN
jgi:hypothetical protein